MNPVDTKTRILLRRFNCCKSGKKSFASIAATVPADAAHEAKAKLKIIPIDCWDSLPIMTALK